MNDTFCFIMVIAIGAFLSWAMTSSCWDMHLTEEKELIKKRAVECDEAYYNSKTGKIMFSGNLEYIITGKK